MNASTFLHATQTWPWRALRRMPMLPALLLAGCAATSPTTSPPAHRAAAQARAVAGQCAPDTAALDLLAELQRRTYSLHVTPDDACSL